MGGRGSDGDPHSGIRERRDWTDDVRARLEQRARQIVRQVVFILHDQYARTAELACAFVSRGITPQDEDSSCKLFRH